MGNCYRLLITTFLIVLPRWAGAHDPGVPDTLRIEAGSIGLGVSSPVVVSVFNDSVVTDFDAALLVASFDSGFARYDSVRYVGRLADPSVLPFRIGNPKDADGVSPDTLIITCLRNALNPLPSGDGPVMELYFTGCTTGLLRIDTSSSSPGGIDFVHSGAGEYHPIFRPKVIEVISPNRPPVLTLPSELPIVAFSSERVEFEVSASSPSEISVQLELLSLTDTDDSSREPIATPKLTGATTKTFSWSPSQQDIGIWSAVFRATDTTGLVSLAAVEIQIVSDERYLVAFERGETKGVPQATGLIRANLDSDPHLDAIVGSSLKVKVLKGRGDGSFSAEDDQPDLPPWSRGATLTDYDGDALLDYAVTGFERVVVYRQSTELCFEEAVSFLPGDTALTINSADFNGDGWDDLAVGTRAGLEIYLNDGQGGYTPGETYAQVFGTTDIEVTNQGSDFNEDGIFDLCLATPSVGGEYSELVVYLGWRDGSFEQTIVRRVKGQIFCNRPGDFNGDAHLDIAWINGTKGYLSIIFGDGDGSFPNELRYAVPSNSPRQLEGVDFDLDGDLDVLVAAFQPGIELNSSFFLFENKLDPLGVNPTSLEIRAGNNASIELRAPGGGRLSRIANSIASGELYLRALDDNAIIDEVAVTRTVEDGRYDLFVKPRQNLAKAETFSLDYNVGDHWFRIAHDQPISPSGYLFPIYPAGGSLVSPEQGEFIHTSLPTFTWESSGVERFELASDIGFADIIESATVTGGVYTLHVVLPYTDSTAYFWRVTSETDSALTPIHAFNAVRIPTDVEESDFPIGLPDSCRLAQNYPNPFNPMTTIEFYLPDGGPVKISIHNVLGQLIKSLMDRSMPPGTYSVDWDATDLFDRPVASGIYFYRMEVGDYSSTRKMVLVR